MPRKKSYRSSEAAKRRMEEKLAALVTLPPRTDVDDVRIGVVTCKRHRPEPWTVSSLTGLKHKQEIPPLSPDKKRKASGDLTSDVFDNKGMDKQQVVSEFSIPLSPVWFSPAVLDLMDSHAPLKSVQGAFHQGDRRFVYPGVQCMAISLVAMAKHTIHSVFSWQPADLDEVLVAGDEVYTLLYDAGLVKDQSRHLSVPELPKQHSLFGHSFEFVEGDVVSGDVDVLRGEFLDLHVQFSLREALDKICGEYDTSFLTLARNTCSIIVQDGRYAVVDSHARNAYGMQSAAGKSVAVFFESLDDVFNHIRRFADGLHSQKEFELSGMHVTTRGLKRKTEKSNVDVEPDVLFIIEQRNDMMEFNPIGKDVSQAICRKLNVEYEKVDVISMTGVLGVPCQNEKIEEDGNCFFRALSQAVTGTQRKHRKIRLAVVEHLESKAHFYKSFLRCGYTSVSDYVVRSKMSYVGTWATEMEIQVAADYLGLNIYTYCNGHWLRYVCNGERCSEQGVYLENVCGNHFETVVCVKRLQEQSCLGVCKATEARFSGYHLRQHGTGTFSVGTAAVRSDVKDKFLIVDKGILQQFGPSLSVASASGQWIHKHSSKYMKRKRCLQEQEKMVENELYKDSVRETARKCYQGNALYKEKQKNKSIQKYDINIQHKEKVKDYSIQKYDKNIQHKEKVKDYSIQKYDKNIQHKEKVKDYSIQKYDKNIQHKEKVKDYSIQKYDKNIQHKMRVKEFSIKKNKEDIHHKEKMKGYSFQKYKGNIQHKEKMKGYSFQKYKGNIQHKEKMKGYSFQKYKLNESHRQRKKALNKATYHKKKAEQINVVIDRFLEKVKDGPDCVCCVCHRLLFKHQVKSCIRESYRFKKHVALLAEQCITTDYLHVCCEDCVSPCQWLDTSRSQLWICCTCDSKLNRGEVPAEWVCNYLSLDPIPEELSCLNSLEQHLIALHIPFMKMLALPKGGQNGVHGPVTCVPANIVETSNCLPRSSMEGSLIPVKLKRKLTYKGHYKYQFVDSARVRNALRYLKENNPLYRDIEFNEEWVNELCLMEEDEAVENKSDGKVENVQSEDAAEDELLHDRQQHCMFQDTCLMPVDIGQEALDQYLDNVLNVAPGEGNNPVKLLSDTANEAKCFPVLFPHGNNTFHEKREVKLTLCRYFNNRLLSANGRFAQNVEYIFYAQYLMDLQQVVSKVSIALRKGKGGYKGTNVGDLLKDEESLKKLLEFDDGFRFLQPIRGTPAFWQRAKNDLLACIRQLGIPTWFCSFSSADMRWENYLNNILRQEGRLETAEQLEWADKCDVLRRNPVAAARLFDFRWHIFMKEVIKSPSHPLGVVVDMFHRVEFQQRGSPHVHCLIWIENAPVIKKNTDKEVVEFVDKYVTCEQPSQDEHLLEIVTSVQQHSKRHSKTCKKGNTVCRFGFPKPASSRTFISHADVPEKLCKCQMGDSKEPCKCKEKKPPQIEKAVADRVLNAVKTALSSESCQYQSIDHLFSDLGITQELFEMAYRRCGKKTHVVLKREIDEVWINPYSKSLLKGWNANMDIQFVVDAYACVVYIISYISKAEKEIGLLLGNAQKEAAKDQNLSAKEAMKRLGTVYLHNRDVCAQEAVYRLTPSMHLKECSRKVVFVPTGDNIVRMSLPLQVLKQKAASGEGLSSEGMWMTSLMDRYRNRPDDIAFNDICMATFASEYRILSKGEKSKTGLKLKKDLGVVAKRTKSKAAVVRYMRFSETKHPESFYQTNLQLFLPHREDLDVKPVTWETFQLFYENGCVRFSDRTWHSVKSVVDSNRAQFEGESEVLDEILDSIDEDDIIFDDAWGQLCPEKEREHLECVEEMESREQMVEEHGEEHIPDLASNAEQVCRLEKRTNILCRKDGLALVESLNEKQLSVFYQIRQWCIDKVSGKITKPFHVFITGGAGTGKSHLIKAIQYESTRLLSTLCHDPDNVSVVLTAPTGIAAFNLKACTIHTTLGIGLDLRLPYIPLGEEKVNLLRLKYMDLQILIIDEVSMVDHRLLCYIHGRLRQIKRTGDFSSFGNVSIIAVGDFYQLPPVKGKPLYVEGEGVHLWSLFQVVELVEIVRQKDRVFAELLNRMRTHAKGSKMQASDVETLKHCETGEVSSALHIYPTNSQVNEHNSHELLRMCPEYVEIKARDFKNSKKTGKLELIEGHHSKTSKTSLEETLLVGVGARVMLIKNVDVEDGLVNGVCGKVTYIERDGEKKFPSKVYVEFDDTVVGAQRRKQSVNPHSDLANSIKIGPEEDRVTSKGGMRKQFPLKLAWACTVHKVQGLTVDSAVVSLVKTFAAGQAYVALSRVKSLAGLILQDFKEKYVYCKGGIKEALENMAPFLVEGKKGSKPVFSMFLMNVQSLALHVSHLALRTQHLHCDCIAVTETWLPNTCALDLVNIDGYSFRNSPRSLAYSGTNPVFRALQAQQHGGVGIFSSVNVPFEVMKLPHVDLECGIIKYVTWDILVAVVYRPPSYPMSLFKEQLEKLLDWLQPLSSTIAVMGDFNDDILRSSSICKFVEDKGFMQLITEPTTERGTLIDHVYVKTSQFEIESVVLPTYFSDHEGIVCCFREKIILGT